MVIRAGGHKCQHIIRQTLKDMSSWQTLVKYKISVMRLAVHSLFFILKCFNSTAESVSRVALRYSHRWLVWIRPSFVHLIISLVSFWSVKWNCVRNVFESAMSRTLIYFHFSDEQLKDSHSMTWFVDSDNKWTRNIETGPSILLVVEMVTLCTYRHL